MKNKIDRLSQLWVKWNLKEISGNDFAMAFRKEFHYETHQAWDERINPQKVIREKARRIHRDKFREKIRREMVSNLS